MLPVVAAGEPSGKGFLLHLEEQQAPGAGEHLEGGGLGAGEGKKRPVNCQHKCGRGCSLRLAGPVLQASLAFVAPGRGLLCFLSGRTTSRRSHFALEQVVHLGVKGSTLLPAGLAHVLPSTHPGFLQDCGAVSPLHIRNEAT